MKKNYDINYAEPEKNAFVGLKRAEIIEIAQQLITTLKSQDANVADLGRHVSSLSWNLNMTQDTIHRYTSRQAELLLEVSQLQADLSSTRDKLETAQKDNGMLSVVLEDAAQQKSNVLLSFTAKMTAAILRGELEVVALKNTYKVVLYDCRTVGDHSSRIGCIKVVREMLNLGLREAKEMTDPAYLDPPQPVILEKGLSRERADAWEKAFKSCTAASAKYAIVQE
jgi:ribosomal protein L7/L12